MNPTVCEGCSGDVQGVKDQHVVIVLGESNNVAFTGDLKTTAARNLDVWTLEFCQQVTVISEDSHVEPVAMRVSYEDVARVWYVDTIGEVSDALAADPSYEETVLREYDHVMSLKITDVKLPPAHSNIAGLSHVVRAVKPTQ